MPKARKAVSRKALLTEQRRLFHAHLLATMLTVDKGIPSIADRGSKGSIAISCAMIDRIGSSVQRAKSAGQTSGHQFEGCIAFFLRQTFTKLSHLRPGTWCILPSEGDEKIDLTRYEQYAHLGQLQTLIKLHPELQATLGSEYLIKPDVVVLRSAEDDDAINRTLQVVDNDSCKLSPLRRSNHTNLSTDVPWFLHASVSCKWTLRSDRAQNARSEALNLIRSRKGRVPLIAAVTAEPLPMRIASLAMGTSDLDCVYHIALPELEDAVRSYATQGHAEQQEMLDTLVKGRRLRDIADLPLDMAV